MDCLPNLGNFCGVLRVRAMQIPDRRYRGMVYHGLYDLNYKEGLIQIGTSHDTCEVTQLAIGGSLTALYCIHWQAQFYCYVMAVVVTAPALTCLRKICKSLATS